MEQGLIAIIITFLIIICIIKTNRCIECMTIGSLIASIFAYKGEFLEQWCNVLQQMFAENVWVFLVCLLFGGFISLLTASKGSFGFSRHLSKICTSQRRTLFVTFIMGILIFVDDYLNVLSIGTCMKRISDERKLPREALAYMLDSTGAPVCVLLPISTWAVFYASLFYEQESVRSLGCCTPLDAYIKAIPFCFYPIITLIIVFLFAMGWFPKLGPMKKAYLRVEEKGLLYSIYSQKYNRKSTVSETDGKIHNFLVPMGILIAVAVITGDILMAVVIALIICFIMYIHQEIMNVEEYMTHLMHGFGDMHITLTMLLVAFVLKEITSDMGMTSYIVNLAEPYLFPAIFPAMVFILGAVLAFTTGSDWGMSSIITPIVFPLGTVIGVNPVLIMAAIISGGTFGSHACFYADATILAAQSSGIDCTEHALSQFPYVIIASIISIICFIVTGIVL